MQVITRDQVKAQLGITDSSYDTQIDAKLPIIDAKVKAICNNNFNYRFAADFTDTETTLNAYALYKTKDQYPSGINNRTIVRDVSKDLQVGMQISGTGIASGTYITNIYKSGSLDVFDVTLDNVYCELSDAVTSDGSGVIVTGGISIAYHDVIAKGVMYMIRGTSTTVSDSAWSSRSIGGASVSRSAADSALESQYGMPAWFVKALPRYA